MKNVGKKGLESVVISLTFARPEEPPLSIQNTEIFTLKEYRLPDRCLEDDDYGGYRRDSPSPLMRRFPPVPNRLFPQVCDPLLWFVLDSFSFRCHLVNLVVMKALIYQCGDSRPLVKLSIHIPLYIITPHPLHPPCTTHIYPPHSTIRPRPLPFTMAFPHPQLHPSFMRIKQSHLQF